MEVRIAHHGHCFDGASSAAFFYRFAQERLHREAKFSFRGLMYEPNAPPITDAFLAVPGAVNVVLDFRYTASPLLSWYFDHHVSAFQEAGSKEHFLADISGQKVHDGTYGSNTKLMADTFRAKHGWFPQGLEELLHWADIVDAARFPNADVATSLSEPALQITAVVQEHGDDALCAELIPRLATESLASIASSPLIAAKLEPIRSRSDVLHARMERAGEQKGDVALFDLTEVPLETVSKFYGYKLFPTALYSVTLSWTPRRTKVSIGFNPWAKKQRRHNIAELCEKYGGGGHPVVGAITLASSELPRGKRIVEEVIAALNR